MGILDYMKGRSGGEQKDDTSGTNLQDTGEESEISFQDELEEGLDEQKEELLSEEEEEEIVEENLEEELEGDSEYPGEWAGYGMELFDDEKDNDLELTNEMDLEMQDGNEEENSSELSDSGSDDIPSVDPTDLAMANEPEYEPDEQFSVPEGQTDELSGITVEQIPRKTIADKYEEAKGAFSSGRERVKKEFRRAPTESEFAIQAAVISESESEKQRKEEEAFQRRADIDYGSAIQRQEALAAEAREKSTLSAAKVDTQLGKELSSLEVRRAQNLAKHVESMKGIDPRELKKKFYNEQHKVLLAMKGMNQQELEIAKALYGDLVGRVKNEGLDEDFLEEIINLRKRLDRKYKKIGGKMAQGTKGAIGSVFRGGETALGQTGAALQRTGELNRRMDRSVYGPSAGQRRQGSDGSGMFGIPGAQGNSGGSGMFGIPGGMKSRRQDGGASVDSFYVPTVARRDLLPGGAPVRREQYGDDGFERRSPRLSTQKMNIKNMLV